MKYILFLLISIGAFAQNTSNVAANNYKVFINGQTAENDTLQLTRNQLKEAVVSLDPEAKLPEKARIASFDMIFPDQHIVVSGNKMNAQTQWQVLKLKAGETITIQNIRYTLPGDKKRLKYTGSQKIMIVE